MDHTGNALGLVGVSTGVGAALASLHVPLPVYAQVLTCLGAGSFFGHKV